MSQKNVVRDEGAPLTPMTADHIIPYTVKRILFVMIFFSYS